MTEGENVGEVQEAEEGCRESGRKWLRITEPLVKDRYYKVVLGTSVKIGRQVRTGARIAEIRPVDDEKGKDSAAGQAAAVVLKCAPEFDGLYVVEILLKNKSVHGGLVLENKALLVLDPDYVCSHSVIVGDLCAECGSLISSSLTAPMTASTAPTTGSNRVGNTLSNPPPPIHGPDAPKGVRTPFEGRPVALREPLSLPDSGPGPNGHPLPQSEALAETPVKLGFVGAESGILVSRSYAKLLTGNKVVSLISSRKLILVLDLDNTLIHACETRPPADLLHPDVRDSLSTFAQEETREVLGRSGEEGENDGGFRPCAVIDGRDIKSQMAMTAQMVEATESGGNRTLEVGSAGFPTQGMSQGMSQGTFFPHYMKESEMNYIAKRRIRCLEDNVFYIETPMYGVAHSVSFLYGHSTSHFKLRRGVIQFLREMSEYFELMVYTAGTEEHAASTLSLLDPERRFFGERVYARKALGADGLKSLAQILPQDHELIIVLDDTLRVWARDVGLVMCYPYIWHAEPTSHFLYRRPRSEALFRLSAIQRSLCQFSPMLLLHVALTSPPGLLLAAEPQPNAGKEASSKSEVEEGLEMKGKRIVNAVLNGEVKLLEGVRQMWDLQCVEARTGLKTPSRFDDTDVQLFNTMAVLRTVHRLFFYCLDKQSFEETIAVPSCHDILSYMRRSILKDCVILFLGDKKYFLSTDLHYLAVKCGARFVFARDLDTPTHVLVDQPLYEKLIPLLRNKAVSFQWLELSCCLFARMPEALFHPEVAAGRRCLWDAIELHACAHRGSFVGGNRREETETEKGEGMRDEGEGEGEGTEGASSNLTGEGAGMKRHRSSQGSNTENERQPATKARRRTGTSEAICVCENEAHAPFAMNDEHMEHYYNEMKTTTKIFKNSSAVFGRTLDFVPEEDLEQSFFQEANLHNPQSFRDDLRDEIG